MESSLLYWKPAWAPMAVQGQIDWVDLQACWQAVWREWDDHRTMLECSRILVIVLKTQDNSCATENCRSDRLGSSRVSVLVDLGGLDTGNLAPAAGY